MANNETTTKFKVDISELKSAMQTAKQQIALANAEFKNATSSMGKWEDSTEGVTAKLTQLDKTMKSQVSILVNLEKQYKAVCDTQGEDSKAAQDLLIKINNQEAACKRTARETELYKEKLDDMSKTENEASKNSNDLSDNLDDVADSAGKSSDGFTVFKGIVADIASNVIRQASQALKDFAKEMVTTAAEVKAQNSQFSQTFGNLSGEATKAINDISNSTGIMSSRLKSAATDIYAFAKASGGDSTQAMDLMKKGLTAAADAAAYYDRSLEDTTKSLESFLKGNYANDAALGVSCTETTRNAEAMELFGKKFNELTEIQKQQTLLKMVTDAQELSGAMGQAAREADGWENVQGNLNEAWRQFTAVVGTPVLETLVPIIEKITKGIEKVTSGIQKFTEWLNESGKAQIVVKGILSAFGTAVVTLAIVSIPTLVKAIITALIPSIEGIGVALSTLMANPVVLTIVAVTAAIAGLCVGFSSLYDYLYETNEGFRETSDTIGTAMLRLKDGSLTLNDIKNNFKTMCKESLDSVKSWASEIVNNAKDSINSFKDSIVNGIKSIPEHFTTWLNDAKTKISDWGTEIVNKAKSILENFNDSISKKLGELPNKFTTWLNNVISKVSNWGTELVNKAKSAISNFIDGINDTLTNLPNKFTNAFSNVMSKVNDWANNLITDGKNAVDNFISGVETILSNLKTKFTNAFTNVISEITNWSSNLAIKGRDAITNFITTITNTLRELPEKMRQAGADMINGVWQGIENKTSEFTRNIKDFFNGIVTTVKEILGIHSPSRVFAEEVGRWIPAGVAIGVEDNASTVLKSMKNLTNDMMITAKDGLGNGLSGMTTGSVSTGSGQVINNYNQTINSPKALNRLDIYRQSKNLLGYVGGGY